MNMHWVLNMSKFSIWQSFENGRVPSMGALHSVMSMPEYPLTES